MLIRNRSAIGRLGAARQPHSAYRSLVFQGVSMRLSRIVVTASLLAMAGCGGTDGGDGSATIPVAPAPTPTPSPSPSPLPVSQSSFPLGSALRFTTLFARLSYSGTPGQSVLSNLSSIGALPGGSIIPSPDPVNGVHRIEEDLLTQAAFATNLRQEPDAGVAQIETYGRPGDSSYLRLLNNSIKPLNSGLLPLTLRYTSFAGWTRPVQLGTQTATSWHVFGFQTPSVSFPSGTRRFEITATGNHIVTTDDGKGIPYDVEAVGGLIVDFDRRLVSFDNLRLIFKGRAGLSTGDISTNVNGTGLMSADGNLSGSFGTIPPDGMQGVPQQSFAAVQFSGQLYGPKAEEVGLVLTFGGPERADRPVRRGYGAGVMVGRPLP